MTDIFVPIYPNNYTCSSCKYITDNKKDFNKHNLTSKHLRLTNYLQKIPEIPKIFICDCGKEYKHRQSLHTHKQKCILPNNENENIPLDTSQNDVSVLTSLVLELVKNN